MKFLADKTTLVLAGSFNPAILNPRWVGTHGLEFPANHQFQVQVEIATPLAGTGGGIQKFNFDGLSYAPSFQSLTFFCDGRDARQCQKASKVAARILAALSHTPMQGVGLNFSFVVEEPSADALDYLKSNALLAEAVGGEAEVVSRTWSNSIKWGNAILTIHCQTSDGGAINIECNLHHDESTAVKASELLMKDSFFSDNFAAAMAVAKCFSGQDLEEP